MKIMYAITHKHRNGFRTLSFANQGRNHFNTREEAVNRLKAMLLNNSKDTLISVYGNIDSFEVRPIECYDHGDAKRIYFDDVEDTVI